MSTLPRSHLALGVTDLAVSLAFYRALLGVEPANARHARRARGAVAPAVVAFIGGDEETGSWRRK